MILSFFALRINGQARKRPGQRSARQEFLTSAVREDLMATRTDTNEQINKAADAGRKAADEAARVTSAAADEAARVGEQTARAGVKVFRRGAETARDTTQASLDAAQQNLQHVTDQFTQMLGFTGPQSEEISRRSSENLQAVIEAGTVLARGAQEVSQQLFDLAQG
jgi:hypothetical protein